MTRLTKNVIYNVTGQGLVLILSLIAVRFIFRRLGDDVFGIIFFNITLTAVLSGALELGVSSTIVREVSSRHEDEPAYVRALIGTASSLYWAAGLLFVAVIWIIAPWLVTHWVILRTIDANTAATTLRLLSGTSLVVLPKALYASVFRGRQLMHFNNSIDVVTAITQQLGTLLLLIAGAHVYLVAAWISVNAMIGISAYIWAAAHVAGWSALRPQLSGDVVRRNARFTGNMMVISILSLIQSQAGLVIVSKLLPIAEFGFYGFAASTVNRAAFVTGAVAQAAFPSFSNLFIAADRPKLMSQYRKLQDLVSYGTMPLFVGIIFAATPVYTYVFNARVASELLLPTAFLCFGSWMSATLTIPYMFSLAVGQPQIALRSSLIGAVIVLPLTVFLVYAFGIAGAAFSWLLYQVVTYVYWVPRICRRCLEISSAAWYFDAGKGLAAAAATYGVAWLLLVIPVGSSPAVLIRSVGYLVGTAVFASIAFLLIGPDLKVTISRLLGMVRARRNPAATPTRP